jgi:hypothetical protein
MAHVDAWPDFERRTPIAKPDRFRTTDVRATALNP